MSILVNKNTRLVVQGITGKEGLFHSQQMLEYGTQVVAGTRPGKGGEWVLDGKVPVFDSVQVAVEATGANTSVIFVPARFAADAILEAADSGVEHPMECRCLMVLDGRRSPWRIPVSGKTGLTVYIFMKVRSGLNVTHRSFPVMQAAIGSSTQVMTSWLPQNIPAIQIVSTSSWQTITM